MSRLFHTERGRMFHSVNEEITRWRWARKVLTLPAAAARSRAQLWLFLLMYDGNRTPLIVSLNGRKLGQVAPRKHFATQWVWCPLPVPAGRLRRGRNELILRSDNPAMNAWVLGIENGHTDPASSLSLDRGARWQNRAMGAHGMLRGEYLIRLRSQTERLADDGPPAMVYENTNHPRVRELRGLLPARIVKQRDPWKQLLGLRTWVATRWSHDNKGRTYSPWDPWTVLDWVRRDTCHGHQGRIAFCVHFAVVFGAFAAALGHRARGVAVTDDFNSMNGHFMCEVWDDSLGAWVLHDPNYDLHYEDPRPLSAFDLADRSHRRRTMNRLVRKGPGTPKGPKYLIDLFRAHFATGTSFRCVGVWSRNDFVSNPAAAPPNHGATSYCETEFVWYDPPGMHLAEPFPYRAADRRYFDAAPSGHRTG